jgi:hypothetical protein
MNPIFLSIDENTRLCVGTANGLSIQIEIRLGTIDGIDMGWDDVGEGLFVPPDKITKFFKLLKQLEKILVLG